MNSVPQNDSEGPRPNLWPANKDASLRELAIEAVFFDKDDPIGATKKAILPTIQRLEGVLMERNAVFAGVYMHHLLTKFHTVAIEYINAWGVVFVVAQLYRAAQKFQRFHWPDVDVMLLQQGFDRIWIGDREPERLEDFYKQWCLSQGMSVTAFNSAGHLPTNVSTAGGNSMPRRGFVELSPVSMMFKDRLGSHDGLARTNLTLVEVRKIIGASEWKDAEADDREYNDSPFELVQEWDIASTRRYGSSQPLRTSPRTDHLAFSPAKVITTLGWALQPELAYLHFDYFTLHGTCKGNLRVINKVVGPLFQSIFGPFYIEHEGQLPLFVVMVFQAAAGEVRAIPVEDRLILLESASEGTRNWATNAGTMVIKALEKLRIFIEVKEE